MTIKKTSFKRNRLAAGLASALAFSISTGLQADEKTVDLDINTQKIGPAMMALGQRAGVQIMFPQDIGEYTNLTTLKGQYTLEAALQTLLKGTGLSYEFTSDTSVLIREEENEANQGAADEEVDEEIMVTGTRLRTNKTYAPVQAITREDIKRRGFNSMEDILRSLSSNQSELNAATVGNSLVTSRLQQGTAIANLRGLGEENTLVLLNGRRIASAASTTGDGTNVAGIPINSIERVEIMTDGGSAIYGADAVAGTINIITRKDYSGSETTLRYESSSNNADSYTLNQAFSMDWGSGNANIVLSHTDEKSASSAKLGVVTNDLTSIGGLDSRRNLLTVQPGNFVFFPGFGDFFIASAPAGALGPGVDPATFTLADIDPTRTPFK